VKKNIKIRTSRLNITSTNDYIQSHASGVSVPPQCMSTQRKKGKRHLLRLAFSRFPAELAQRISQPRVAVSRKREHAAKRRNKRNREENWQTSLRACGLVRDEKKEFFRNRVQKYTVSQAYSKKLAQSSKFLGKKYSLVLRLPLKHF
jgi:post-segregation antitoxin (ccd killing protein)